MRKPFLFQHRRQLQRPDKNVMTIVVSAMPHISAEAM